jgi:MFS family permease
VRRLLGKITIDIGPLRRHRDYRLLFGGRAFSQFGGMFTYVAVPYQAYALSGSSLVVGLLGVAELVPLLVAAMLGGMLADARDRRRMVQLTELALAVASGVLLVNALLPDPQLWVIFIVAAIMSTLEGLQRPSLDAMEPRLVDQHEIPAVGALRWLSGDVSMVLGPALAGLTIAALGLPATYGIDVLTFLVSLGALRLMKAVPPPVGSSGTSLRSVKEGVSYVRTRPDLLGTYTVDIIAMFFGMPMALFPAMADRLGGAGALGLLYAAPSIGSGLVAVSSGWVVHVNRQGRAICFAAASWGLAIIAFGFAPTLLVAVIALALAGAGDGISGLFRMTVWNQTIPDRLRGRLAGIEQLSYSTGPLLGNVESGIAASLLSVRAAVVSGGVLCVVGVGVAALALPALWHYDARVMRKLRDETPAPQAAA